MATIKAYTDINQSKKLAEILPLESADMYYNPRPSNEIPYVGNANTALLQVPCWSLASLFSILPKIINNETLFIETSPALWHIGYRNIYTARADNPVDACYEMIIRLNELKTL